MKLYEGYFVLPPEATAEVRKQQVKSLEDLIKKFNGKTLQKTELGKRPLGYTVRKFREGYAVVVEFELDSLQQDNLKKSFQLQEEVVKFMITCKKPVVVEKPEAAKASAKPAAPKKNLQEQSAS